MDVRRMANGLVSRQTSRLISQHFAPIRRSIPQSFSQSIRTISTSQPLSSNQRDTPVTTQQKTSPSSNNGFDVDSISNLLDDVYDRVGTSNQPGRPGQGGRQNVATAFRSLFQNSDVGSITRAVHDTVANNSTQGERAVPRYPGLKLGPKLGRTVAVDPSRGVDVNQAFAMMEAQVARNKIRADQNAQRFHIRRGKKRKILKSKRWRILFKKSFQATVARCMELKRQGW
ncbi:hypothetical protein McanMca71_007059 [Microsporum canis]|uniref:Ribosomal protein S21 n=1 Tax=Arthroderma otae (strain ATCC MYA-4605 / CBS 113480) TaxID=554155 RepID=C5FNQ1_ARTOC|nr:conserved hypothetical protein [Microsporum canis CBS 113480]EEQ31754.1 conserved hypothetical protein [Microsporum canis CBS 113480]